MKVIITGGSGFLGLRLMSAILDKKRLIGQTGKPELVESIILLDASVPTTLPANFDDDRVSFVEGSITDRNLLNSLITGNSVSIFHLASVVSAGAEQDFNLALDVNLYGGINLLEAARAAPELPKVVFTSSLAAFGGSAMPDTVSDETKITPMTTYGMTKASIELLLNDYTRKGFLDGRGARLPTVIIRPGKPNKAASGFASGVFREPLSGKNYEIPVSYQTRMAVSGYRTVIDGILRIHEIKSEDIGDDRSINLPSISITVQDMVDGLHRVAENRTLGNITCLPNTDIQKICDGWPKWALANRALDLGLPENNSIDEIIRAYIEDYAKL